MIQIVKTLKNFFKKDSNIRNIYHPEIKDQVQYSFTCKGTKYYSFKDDYKMLAGRYFVATRFFRELSLTLTSEVLNDYINAIIKDCNKGDLVKVAIKLNELKSRNELAVEEETLYRLASVVYFDETESVDTYNREYNESKISSWKESGQLGFFFTKPMTDYINLTTFSEEDLRNSLSQARDQNEKLKELMYEL